ncbi:hypothetical protein B9Z19DRAFT_1092531 [Tuber borchii]|uniref:Secreted protein n=1 Tax=Tuber borchii TaxID=42251 RepID=A0A2T6ZGA8_TUBBO|nr:hypothetical protein B9Z19DRAFT_1092531 [Tuber borchii]
MGCSGCLWILLDKLAVLFFPLPSFLFSFELRTGKKGHSSNNYSHANRLCSPHFSAFRSPKVQKRRQEKENKEGENGPKKNKNRNPYSEQRKEGGKGKGTRSKK